MVLTLNGIVMIIFDFIYHLSYLMILNVALAGIIVLIMKSKLDIILNNKHNKKYFKEDSLLEDIDKSLSIFKVLILISMILIFFLSLFTVFNWIEELLPSLLNFFLYFLVLVICSFTHIGIYYVSLNKRILKLRDLVEKANNGKDPDIEDDDIVYAIESNNVQLETFLNYFLSISIFYSSLHPIVNESTIAIPILIAQSVFIIKVSENYLIKIFSK